MLDPILNKDSKHWLRRDRFSLYTAREFLREPSQVRNAVGVYVILLRNAADVFSRAHLPSATSVAQWNLLDYHHVYTGLSTAMRSRATLHICGVTLESAVRESLLALQFSDKAIWEGDVPLTAWEDQLTDWLAENAVVGFKLTDEPHTTEKALIERLPSPFNTAHNLRSSMTQAIAQRRELYRMHLQEMGYAQHRSRAASASQWLVKEAESHLLGWQSRQIT